ncbi:hypothetical protein C9221_03590 [Escherichia coli]|nr:hypothetical protein C9221_03590 [Escherichia coli]
MVITIVLTVIQKTTPRSGGSHTGRLTKPLIEVTIMAIKEHSLLFIHTQTPRKRNNPFHSSVLCTHPGGRFLRDFSRRGQLAKNASNANSPGFISIGISWIFRGLASSASRRAQVSNCLCRMISSSCVCVSCIGNSVLLVMVLPCKAMRRSTSRHGADSNYSFDSMPRLSNSRRKSLFIHPERLSSPSSFMAMLKRSNKSASRRSCTENLSFLLSLVDIVYLEYNNGLTVTMYTNDTTKAKPAGAMNTNGLLTNNVNEEPLWLP